MYSPKIKPELVRKLYILSQTKNLPMTVVANDIIAEYFIKMENRTNGKKKTDFEIRSMQKSF